MKDRKRICRPLDVYHRVSEMQEVRRDIWKVRRGLMEQIPKSRGMMILMIQLKMIQHNW